MKQNGYLWLRQLLDAPQPQAIPILSYPGAQGMGVSMSALLASSALQAQCMKRVADATPSAAAFTPMDLSVEAESLGARVQFFEEDVPAVVGSSIHSMEDVEALQLPQTWSGRMRTAIDTVEQAKALITDRPVFAGMIGPYSLAGRLLDVTESIYLCYDEPELVEALLEKLTDYLIRYGRALKQAGADGIVLAEPLAGTLSPTLEAEFSAPYVRRIIGALQEESCLLIYHNCGDSVAYMADSIFAAGAAAYHFGNAIDLAEMIAKAPAGTVIMGNIDPAREFCNGTPQSIALQTRQLLERCGSYPGFVISSGCDVPMGSPWENIHAFYAAVAEFGKRG